MAGPARIYIAGKGWVDVEQAGMGADFTGPIQTPADHSTALSGLGLTNPNAPQPDPRTPEQKSTEQTTALQQFLAGLLEVGAPLALAPATGGASTLTRMAFPLALDALTGAGAGAITGEGAGKEALDNATLGAAGIVGSEFLPKIGLTLGQWSGKKFHDVAADSDAFLKYRAQAPLGKAIPLGSQQVDTTREALKQAGTALGDAAAANPARIPIASTVDQAIEPLIKGVVGNRPAIFPTDTRLKLQDMRDEFIKQNRFERGSMVPDAPAFINTTGTLVDNTALSTARRRPLPGVTRQVKDAVPLEDGVIDVEKLGSATFQPATDLSMSDLVWLRATHNDKSREVIKARKAGQLVPADEELSGQFNAAMSSGLKKVMQENDPSGAITSAYGDVARLKQMQETNSQLRPLSPLVRMGLGYGAGRVAEYAGLPIDPQVLALIMAAAGTPKRASGLGFALGHAAKVAPRTTRIVETGKGMYDASTKSVKRKEPK